MRDICKVVYVIGAKKWKSDAERASVLEEQKTYGDLVLLDIKENMNNGKSHLASLNRGF